MFPLRVARLIDYMIKASSVKVSILMPVFNAEHTLHFCLESIFAQTVHNYEVIAVNDFSTDNSVKIMRSYNDRREGIIGSDHFT